MTVEPGRIDLEVRVVDDAPAGSHLVDVAGVAWIVLALEGIAKERFLVERNQHVDGVDMGPNRHRRGGDPVIAVLAHDVGVELDVGEDVEPTVAQRLGIDLR